MNFPIGATVKSGAVYPVTTPAAPVADLNEVPKRWRQDAQVRFADAGYTRVKTGVEPGIWPAPGPQ